MIKLYVMKDEFFADRPRMSVIKNMKNINRHKDRYYIDPDALEVFRVEHYHRNPHVNEFGQKYDLVLAQLETKGASRSVRGHRVVHIEKRVYTLAKIIAATFISNPHRYADVMHVNGIKEDDRIENLRWCSRSELVTQNKDRKQIKFNFKKEKKKDMQINKQALNAEEVDDDDIIWSKAYTKEEIANMSLDSDYSDK